MATLSDAFPDATIYTSLFEPATTFPAFGQRTVVTTPLNRVKVLRRSHRAALPFLAKAFSDLRVEADVAVCSTSGWAHGATVTGRKLVFCHTPARWLYLPHDYFSGRFATLLPLQRGLAPRLRRWDRRAALGADRYLAISTVIQKRIADVYGIEAEIVHSPRGIEPAGETEPVAGVDPGFLLSVGRLMPYKHVDRIVAAMAQLPGERLVVAGTGPEAATIQRMAGPNVTMTGAVNDRQLRWLYANAGGLVVSSREDFGLTPPEAFAFGKPVAALRAGGFLDSVVEGTTGVFFDEPEPSAIAQAVRELRATAWSTDAITTHGERFSPTAFTTAIHRHVDDLLR